MGRLGRGIFSFDGVYIESWSAAVGPMEDDGPFRGRFDTVFPSTYAGEKCWERAEARLVRTAYDKAVVKTGYEPDVVFAGDLLNQCMGSSFGLRGIGAPFLGLYGACSTMAEGLLLASSLVGAGYAERAAAVTSSHFAAAERQYRTPMEYGNQRPPSAQWTVTGAGAVMLSRAGSNVSAKSETAGGIRAARGIRVARGAVGIVRDMGVTDANEMGAAMAPAAYSTLRELFDATATTPEDYDLILTGDLGSIGRELVRELFALDGVTLGERYDDCGCLIYDAERQDVHSGGSGCGCSAATLCGPLLADVADGKYNRVIFAGTGAMLSRTSVLQKESIPAVCHAVVLERDGADR